MKKLVKFLAIIILIGGNTNLKAQCNIYAGPDQYFCCPGVTNLSASFTSSAGCTCSNVSYVWTPTTGLSNPYIANPTATIANITYTVCATALLGSHCNIICCQACDVISLIVTTPNCCRLMNINEKSNINYGINVFPNPAKNNLTVDINENLNKAELNMYDISGRVVWKKENITGKEKIEISVSSLPRGIYFIKALENGAEVYTNKIILE